MYGLLELEGRATGREEFPGHDGGLPIIDYADRCCPAADPVFTEMSCHKVGVRVTR